MTITGVPKVIQDPWMSFHFSLSRLLSDAWPCTFQVLLSPPSVKTRYNSGRGGAWFRLFGLPWGPEVCRDEIELNPMTTLTLTNELVRCFYFIFFVLVLLRSPKVYVFFFWTPYVRTSVPELPILSTLKHVSELRKPFSCHPNSLIRLSECDTDDNDTCQSPIYRFRVKREMR